VRGEVGAGCRCSWGFFGDGDPARVVIPGRGRGRGESFPASVNGAGNGEISSNRGVECSLDPRRG
jgi:hypothetical protein